MSKRTDNQKLPKKQFSNYAKYSAMASQMIIIMLVGTLGGRKLDEWVNWKFPVFTLVGALLSVFLAIYIPIRDLLKKK